MQLQTILNNVRKFKGHVYENVTLPQDGKKPDVHIRPRRGSCLTCSVTVTTAIIAKALTLMRFVFVFNRILWRVSHRASR